jgi:hypothetical protein
MKLAAHGIAIDVPAGWDGRIYRPAGGPPVLHAASFTLPDGDGDFGSSATGVMPAAGAFLALKEFEPDARLRPGEGLFASRELSLPLDERHFHPRVLQVGRRGQAGMQHFFTTAGRPLCLYAVISTAPVQRGARAASARGRIIELNRIVSSLAIG